MTYDKNDIMAAYTVVFDGLVHLGPGDAAITRTLADEVRPYLPAHPRIADFGCGVGASALVLAQSLPMARVLALDNHAPFVARLKVAAAARGLGERMSAVVGDMAEPPPLDGSVGAFDLIWSESAIYSLGRTHAFAVWRPLLQAGGWLVFSDIVWQREAGARSAQASAFWTSEYPDMTTTDTVMTELAEAGLHPRDLVLPGEKAWSNYYEPLRARLRRLATRADRSPALTDLMADMEREITVYDNAAEDVALAFFLAQGNVSAE